MDYALNVTSSPTCCRTTYYAMWVRWTTSSLDFGRGTVVGEDSFLYTNVTANIDLTQTVELRIGSMNPYETSWKICLYGKFLCCTSLNSVGKLSTI